MTFWARVVIHSTWRCHSGGVADVALGGGASSALRKEEYVTSMDFRIYRSAGRRSVVECIGSERIEKCQYLHTCRGVLWVQLVAADLSKGGNRLLELFVAES